MTICHKRKYRDEIAARFALARAGNRRRPTARDERRAYWCRKCRAWHLTSNGKAPA